MRKLDFFNLLLICLLALGVFSTAYAQDETPASDAQARQNNRFSRRPNLLRELGLKPEQMQQIKRLNQDRKPAAAEAQRRVREATHNLDRAIYADIINEAEIAARLKELQSARAEIDRLRSFGELEVRKILTPEQLVKFREIRRRFSENREAFENRRNNRPDNRDRRTSHRRFNRQLRRIPN